MVNLIMFNNFGSLTIVFLYVYVLTMISLIMVNLTITNQAIVGFVIMNSTMATINIIKLTILF
jgi:hypothetical protein